MGKRDLAGLGVDPAADQRRHRGRVVWRAERAPVGQRSAGERAGDRVNHRHFQELARRQRREDRGQALGEHRLTGPRRAAHEQIVPASRSDLERALGALLPLDVAQIRLRAGRRTHRRLRPRQDLASLEMVGELDQRARGQDVEIGGRPGRLRPARGRANEPLACRVGSDRGRQNARDPADDPVERELADDAIALKRIVWNGADRRHHAERDRQVVVAPLLGQVSWGEIDGDALRRQREAGSSERRADALLRLPHRLVAEADDVEHDIPRGDMHLHVDRAGFHPLERHGRNASHHACPAGLPIDRTFAEHGSPRKGKVDRKKTVRPHHCKEGAERRPVRGVPLTGRRASRDSPVRRRGVEPEWRLWTRLAPRPGGRPRVG